jgi:hypothetical protein
MPSRPRTAFAKDQVVGGGDAMRVDAPFANYASGDLRVCQEMLEITA